MAILGNGSLFRQPGRPNYMMQYYVEDAAAPKGRRRVQVSTYCAKKKDAEKVLRDRLTAIDAGTLSTAPTIKAGTRGGLTIEGARDLYDRALLRDKRTTRVGIIAEVNRHLIPYFEDRKLSSIQSAEVNTYTDQRLKSGAAHATVHKELTALSRMFNVAIAEGRIGQRPKFNMPKIDNARDGFFERHEFDAIHALLPDYMQPLATAAYETGWRVASELCQLEWTRGKGTVGVVDVRRQVIELYDSKNGEPRVFPYGAIPALVAVIDAQYAQHVAGQSARWVFHRNGAQLTNDPTLTQRTGSLLDHARTAWEKACKDAKVVRLLHDCRRTAVRNFVNHGMPEKVAMRLTGHKTRVIFDRYNIVNARDLDAQLRTYAAMVSAVASTQPPPTVTLPDVQHVH